MELPSVKELYIFPHMGDGGLALGAAMVCNHKLYSITKYKSDTLYLGNGYTEDQIIEYLEIKRIDPCQERRQTAEDKSGTIGSRNVRTARSGVAPGSTQTPDRHAAHHLAQMTFGKRS